MDNLKKITIFGGPGTGKSTLANNLGHTLNLPIYHLDSICHLDNWVRRDKSERNKMILNIINQPEWVIDGTYNDTLKQRLETSDLVIFLDFSPVDRINGIFSRYIKYKGKERPDIPGCTEKLDVEFIKYAINWYQSTGGRAVEILNSCHPENLKIFKNREEVNSWFYNTFHKKMVISLD